MTRAAPLPFFGQIAPKIGRGGALIVRRRGPCAAFRPTSCDLVLLADARFIGEPDFYRGRIDALLARDPGVRESFFKILDSPIGFRMVTRASGELAIAQRPQLAAQGLLRD